MTLKDRPTGPYQIIILPSDSTPHVLCTEALGHVDSLYHEGKICIPGLEGIPHGQAKLVSRRRVALDCMQFLILSHDSLFRSHKIHAGGDVE